MNTKFEACPECGYSVCRCVGSMTAASPVIDLMAALKAALAPAERPTWLSPSERRQCPCGVWHTRAENRYTRSASHSTRQSVRCSCGRDALALFETVAP